MNKPTMSLGKDVCQSHSDDSQCTESQYSWKHIMSSRTSLNKSKQVMKRDATSGSECLAHKRLLHHVYACKKPADFTGQCFGSVSQTAWSVCFFSHW